ncbi:hypothetical protein JRO89_XS06G0182100 [Xanthoceras sorbifolium]|uniref:Glycosyl transferase family 1 domain-containing protein n=1 Tax=Xanthoceras sorbifolium TaxID=99658 RepID=A0ABQ8HZB8_9ROSI|nr:hypothetical protein JRO89_XS06G0182100 [Xanthoceras sorbifolium]
MEDSLNNGDLHVNVGRQSSLRQSGSFKSSLSGRSTPKNSPSFRRLNASRTPRRDARTNALQWFRSNRLIYWLLLITLWTYLGFYVQSRWAHGDNNEKFLGFGGKSRKQVLDSEQNMRRDLLSNDSYLEVTKENIKTKVADDKRMDVVFAKKENGASSRRSVTKRKRSKRSSRSKGRGKQKATMDVEDDIEAQQPEIPMTNASYGLLVGPFGLIEDKILDWSPEKRSGTCDRKGNFARLVWSRKFILIFHELSMTGAPLSMMELATELLSCGATVSAVVLSKKGGLMPELARRRIKVVEDRGELSFKTSMKADLVIAGSAVCSSWIDQYIARFPAGGSQIVWWIMENRREYFDRAKPVLHRVKLLIFLSESQTKQWQTWCEEENIKLRSKPEVVPLSVNDELAFIAGFTCSLNTPTLSPENMLEKRKLLRDSVRKEMGLTDNDMLVMSLSSINPGKGQLLLVESANLIIEKELFRDESKIKNPVNVGKKKLRLSRRHHLRGLLQMSNDVVSSSELSISNESLIKFREPKRKNLISTSLFTSVTDSDAVSLHGSHKRRKVLSDSEGTQELALKVLIGSVGSKSNKVPYVKEILQFLSQHSNLSKSMLWTPATTRVASLYSAADVYIINSQGLGETFGRVTIEAMAFGVPVLGTDAGGTKEIVEHNVTGLLHPTGHPGTQVLAQNIGFLLKNPSLRKRMGLEGRKKVGRMYLKRQMYKKLGEVLYKCMRFK